MPVVRAVFDPGVLISAAISRGPPHQLLMLWARGGFELVVSHRLLYELEAVLMRPWFRRKLSYGEVLEYIVWLRERAMLYEEGKIERIITDPDDDYLVALFRASEASVIVSGDRHLLDIGELRDSTGEIRLRAVSPQQFLEDI